MTTQAIDLAKARQWLSRLDALLEGHPELRQSEARARLETWLQEEQRAMADYAAKTRERVQRLRQRRKQAGWTQHELWLDPASTALMAQLMQSGENVTGVVQRALQALAQARTPAGMAKSVTSNGTDQGVSSNASIDLQHPRERKAALLRRLREMKAQGLSLKKMAAQLNIEGIPTLSGKGQWRFQTIGKLLAEVSP